MNAGETLTNALTIDVEDYFQVSALRPHIDRASWDGIPLRVEANVERILQLMADRGARGTFFTLGWVAERHPGLVRRIVDNGHELASHGHGHDRANELSPLHFTEDIVRAKRTLEDIGGVAVRGYRAPSFSIGAENPWALDSILEAGYAYSSSIYPVKHDHYGVPDAPRFPFRAANGLWEIPMTTIRLGNRNWPAGGGGFFRLLPYPVSRWAIRRVNRGDGRPAMFYFHPWEVDPGQPRVAGVGMKTRFRHYLNLHRTEGRLVRLLSDFRWDRIDRVFPEAAQ
jgi:polysaccharide deacetylase family protein (PEP-CTERM system associated)